jgi:hypothetical protein
MKSNRLFSRLEDWGMDDGSHFTTWGGRSFNLKTAGKKEECVEGADETKNVILVPDDHAKAVRIGAEIICSHLPSHISSLSYF